MRRHFSNKAVLVIIWALAFGAIALFVYNLVQGPSTFPIVRLTVAEVELSLALRIDSLSTLIFFMITMLGAAIARFAIRYLDGEARQWYFFKYLLLTVVAVSLFVLSSNLLMLYGMLLLTAYGLHKLLVFYGDRPAAIIAARKKIIISRIGDLALLGGFLIIYRVFGTFEFADIFSQADSVVSGSRDGQLLSVAGLLLAAGAMAKSAQVPFHFWLPETMETPAPVSALMHAGIINAGGFLIIRLSPILHDAHLAHLLLVIVGAFTAVFGALVMITQNDIKKKLAYSTVSQMGMMMFACGLGAYTVALFHMFAHSFYKAHAFLATGTLIEESKKVGYKLTVPSRAFLLPMLATGAAILIGGLYYKEGAYFAATTYGAVLLIALFHNASRPMSNDHSPLRVSAIIIVGLAIAFATYAGIEYGMALFLQDLVPIVWHAGSWDSPQGLLSLFAYAIFAVGAWVSPSLMRPQSALMKRVYVYFWNGGYLSEKTTRWLHSVAPVRADVEQKTALMG